MTISMVAVDSNCFSEIGFDEELSLCQITFRHGRSYAAEMNLTVYEDFASAASKGNFWRTHLRYYGWQRVG